MPASPLMPSDRGMATRFGTMRPSTCRCSAVAVVCIPRDDNGVGLLLRALWTAALVKKDAHSRDAAEEEEAEEGEAAAARAPAPAVCIERRRNIVGAGTASARAARRPAADMVKRRGDEVNG